MERLELILHPIRMRVILTLGHQVLTPQQLASLLPDVAQTTLYRQIKLLLEGGVLQVVDETRVRGTLERRVALVQGAARIDAETSAALPAEQQAALFTTFIASLLAQFQRVQAQPYPGLPHAFYTQQRLHMSAEELQAVNEQMEALLAPYRDAARSGDDTLQWNFTGIVMPDADQFPNQEENQS